MTLRPNRISALFLPAFLLGTSLFSVSAPAQSQAAPQSAYGGTTVEDILARVNDQIITRSDYDRAMKEMDAESRQRGATSMQQIAEGHKDLLRNLIDQQLWISKGKELNINGETELVKQLDEIRKKYNLETLEDLEKAAREQGVSFEDFKANIRNQIITQQVMREEVGRRVSITPGEVQRYFEAHKEDYAQPDSVRLSEILISTGTDTDDAAKIATAKSKADDIEAKLKGGADFDQLARTLSNGPTAAQGGDLGKFGRGKLAKVLEDKTFALQAGQYTEPIRTKQGYVILKVTEHVNGIPQFKDVQQQVEETFYMSRMEPAMRAYLTTMREQAYIDIKPGYTDTGASSKQTKPIYSAYTPPASKKKKKVQRTRFRETERSFRNKSGKAAVVPVSADTSAAAPATADPVSTSTAAAPASPAATAKSGKSGKAAKAASTSSSMKAGKKEKIRFGQAPRETLPNSTPTKIEDAGALPPAAPSAQEAENPSEPAPAPVKKTRYTARLKLPKEKKAKGPQLDSASAANPLPPAAEEVADRQTQAAPLGLAGDTSKKKKKKTNTGTTGEKTRIQDRPKDTTEKAPVEVTPAPSAPGAPAPKAPGTSATPAPEATPEQTPAAPTPAADPAPAPTPDPQQ